MFPIEAPTAAISAAELERYAAIPFVTRQTLTIVEPVVLALAVGFAACSNSPRAAGQPIDRPTCDSTRAAQLALDSLARLDPFRSAVLRFQRDSAGVRIVTWPEPRTGTIVRDGMAIVRVSPACRIVSLVQTDSA